MAKVSSIQCNNKRIKLVKRYAAKRLALKKIVMDKTTAPEERFAAVRTLSEIPRNSAKNRVRNRCSLTGRSRAYYRKFKISRIMLRELGSQGLIPGLVKASW
jgi:small subunit ribosomal protein S14